MVVILTPATRVDNPLTVSSKVPGRVAIDGPSASGKSTVGSKLALTWGYDFLDSGLMYRAVTLFALDRCVNIDDAEGLGALAESLTYDVRKREDGSWALLIDDEDVTDRLHNARIDGRVSPVSATPQVRVALVTQQRRIAEGRSIVMAGRDIGTVVLPDAPLKIFLTASDQTRAERRHEEIKSNGGSTSFADVLNNIRRRDQIDSTRDHSPLRPAEDSIVILTDEIDAATAVQRIVDYYA